MDHRLKTKMHLDNVNGKDKDIDRDKDKDEDITKEDPQIGYTDNSRYCNMFNTRYNNKMNTIN